MKRSYCHVCDKLVDTWHGREHFNWEEFATPERIARAEERRIGYRIMLQERVRRINEKSNT